MSRRWLTFVSLVLALMVLLPILTVLSSIAVGPYDIWQHLYDTVLADYVINSFSLAFGVSIGVLLIGVPSAWLVSLYDFPLRKQLTWLLLLPLAIPAYIIAYTYTGLLDFAGPLQSWIRSVSGWQYGDYWFFEIRSLTGAMLMLTLVLYPYVYLLARSAFVDQSASIVEASQTLGHNRLKSMWLVAFPMARPAIVVGVSLAIMETLADYGTVEYFGVNTFTTGIFRTFYGFGDLAAAAQLSGVLFLFVLVLFLIEKKSRNQSRYFQKQGKLNPRITLTGKHAFLATLFCCLPVMFGFFIPVAQLTHWAMNEAIISKGFLQLVWNSFSLAAFASVLVLVCGAFLAYCKRLVSQQWNIQLINAAGMGYALPGTIIAIGVLIPLTWLDHQFIGFTKAVFNYEGGLILSGSLFILLIAYLVRFLTISLNAVDSGLQKISPNIDSAAQLMGERPMGVFKNIHLPLLKGSIFTALLIVFVDVLKELPATLILRPFDFNTLAVKAYELASDERLIDAAPASLLIVIVGLLPVFLLSRSIDNIGTK